MNQNLKIHISLVLLLWCTSIAMGQIKVIDNKGSFKQIDTSKWTSSGLNIFNKNSGNVGIGLGNPTAKLHTMGLLKFDGLPYGAQTDSLLMLFGGNVRKLSFGDINYFWRLGGNNPSSGASLGSIDSDLPIISNGSLGITLKADANAIIGNKIDHTLGSNNNSNLSLTSVVNNTKQTIDNDNYENIFIGGIDKTVNNHHIITLGTELNDFQNNSNLIINQDKASTFQNNSFIIANGNKFSDWNDNSRIIANGEGIQMKDVNVAEVFGTGSISGQGDAVLLIDNGSINTKLSHIGGQDSYINSIGGNVGIGNDNPQRKLHLTGDLRFEGLNTNTIDTSILTSATNGDITKRSINSILGSNAWTLLGNTGTNATNNFLGTTNVIDLVFRTNNVEKARLFSLANPSLGLGRSSLTGVSGGASSYSGPTIFFGNAGNLSSSTGMDFIIDDDNNAVNSQVFFKANGDVGVQSLKLFQINENGNIGIGINDSTASAKLHTNGTVRMDSLGTNTVNTKILTTDSIGNVTSRTFSNFLAGATRDSTTAQNGLTMNGKAVELGGTLQKATVITQTAAKDSLTFATGGNKMKITGLTSGSNTDSIVVVDPNTGQLKRVHINRIITPNLVSTSVTSYTLSDADHYRILDFTAATAVTLNVPNTLMTGFQVSLTQAGTGQITIVGTGGMVVNNRWGGTKTSGRWAKAGVEIRASNSAILSGDVQ